MQFLAPNNNTNLCVGCRSEKGKMGNYNRCFFKNKKIVFERDNHKCQCCGISEDGNGNNKLIAHHVDVDTRNNSPSNLITLCFQCHQSLHAKYTKYVLRRSNIYKLFADDINFGEFGKNLIYGAAKKIVKKQFNGRPKLFFNIKKQR